MTGDAGLRRWHFQRCRIERALFNIRWWLTRDEYGQHRWRRLVCARRGHRMVTTTRVSGGDLRITRVMCARCQLVERLDWESCSD